MAPESVSPRARAQIQASLRATVRVLPALWLDGPKAIEKRATALLLAGRSGTVQLPRDGSYFGALFESLCAMSVRVFAQACEASVSHLRTAEGRHEIDLIVEREGRILALDVKLSASVDDADVAHLRWLSERLGDQLVGAAVLTTGPAAYRRADGIAVIPLALLGA